MNKLMTFAVIAVSVTIPMAANAASGAHDWSWSGAGDGESFSDGANWTCGSAPDASSDLYFEMSVAQTLVNDIANLSVKSITFTADCGSQTISGQSISLATAAGTIVNSSGRPQTFTAPVAFPDVVQATQYIKQNGWNLQNENSRIMFNGGVTGTRNSANYENRVFCGHWVLSETPYPALPIDGSKRPTVYRNSSFTVDQISSSQAMWVMDGGAVTSATLTVDSKCVATTCLGQFVVNGTMTYDTDKDTSASGGRSTTDKFDFNNGGNNTVATVKAVTMNMTGSRGVKLGGNGVAITSKIYLGSGGMSASGTQCYYVSNSGAQLVLKPWKCDTSINQSAAGENAATIEMRTSGTALTFDTDDEDGVARTISLDGIVSTVADATSSVKGAGTLAVKKSQSFAGSLSVDDTATLKVAQSGTVTLGGNLTLGASASLAFNFTDKATAPTLVIPASSTIPATVNVKVSANDGIRLSPSQTYALTSTFDFTGKTVHLVNPPKWVKSVYVDGSGNLVMKLKQKGFMILVK